MIIRTAFVLALLALATACEGPEELIRNPDIDVWCGDKPCGWEVDGRIERVGTWHSHDYAVSFASSDARLHQLNAEVDDSIGCMSFSMIAKVEADAHAVETKSEIDRSESRIASFSSATSWASISW